VLSGAGHDLGFTHPLEVTGLIDKHQAHGLGS
jgi:hypothetical protein